MEQDYGRKTQRRKLSSSNNESLSDFPKYQQSLTNYANVAGIIENYPRQPQVWEEPIILQLEELLLAKIHSILTKAVEIISAHGYTAYEARETIWNSCLKSQTKYFELDTVVTDALAYLKIPSEEKVGSSSKDDFSYRDLPGLVSCSMFGMLWIVMDCNPTMNLRDAMWSLVMSDLNVSYAMKMEENIANEISSKEAKLAAAKLKVSADQSNVVGAAQFTEESYAPQSSNPNYSVPVPAQSSYVGLKSGAGNKKKPLLRKSNKEIKIERKLAREQKRFLEMKVTGVAKYGVKIDEEKESSDSSIVVALPAAETKVPAAVPKKPEAVETPPPVNYYAGIPYDQTLMKYCPRDEKEAMIVSLAPHFEELEKELQEWSEWASTKMTQAMHMLGKNQAELKMLRKEKEEVEKEKMEEDVAKKMIDMEGALRNACLRLENNRSTCHRLEKEKSVHERDCESAVVRAEKAADRCKAVMKSEKEAIKKVELIEGEKAFLKEQLRNEKVMVAQMLPQMEKARKKLTETQAKLKQEQDAKLNALMDGASIREERQRIEAVCEEEEEAIKLEAELEKQRCMEKMKKIETQISALTLESETALIAKLRKGMAESCTGSSSRTMKVEMIPRECVMCLGEELSVLFLPCAHQVLCRDCNEIHTRKGMRDCPSCRALIERRVITRFRQKKTECNLLG